VRATGGLDDTVQEWSAETETGTGFRFNDYRPEEFLGALGRAFASFTDKKQWQKLMRNAWPAITRGPIQPRNTLSFTKRSCAEGLRAVSFSA